MEVFWLSSRISLSAMMFSRPIFSQIARVICISLVISFSANKSICKFRWFRRSPI